VCQEDAEQKLEDEMNPGSDSDEDSSGDDSPSPEGGQQRAATPQGLPEKPVLPNWPHAMQSVAELAETAATMLCSTPIRLVVGA
jgi:hypothetical protein